MKKKNKMTEKLVLDENIICNAIELKNRDRKYDKTSARVILSIYKNDHKIVRDKFIWGRYKKRIGEKYNKKINERPTSEDLKIIRSIKDILYRSKNYVGNINKYAKPLPANIEDDFNETLGERNYEDLKIARVAAENKVYALITDDHDFHEWVNNILLERYELCGLTPDEALVDAALKLY